MAGLPTDGRDVSVVWPAGFRVRFEPERYALRRCGPGAWVGPASGSNWIKSSLTAMPEPPEDPYIASGILFGTCYPFVP